MDLAGDRLSTVMTIEMTVTQAVGAGAQDPHRRDGPTLPRGRRCRRHSPLRPGPPPAPPAPGVLNAQQQDALASPAPQLPQVRDDEGVKLPQLPGTWGEPLGHGRTHSPPSCGHAGTWVPRPPRSCPDRQTLDRPDPWATRSLLWASVPTCMDEGPWPSHTGPFLKRAATSTVMTACGHRGTRETSSRQGQLWGGGRPGG